MSHDEFRRALLWDDPDWRILWKLLWLEEREQLLHTRSFGCAGHSWQRGSRRWVTGSTPYIPLGKPLPPRND